MGGLEGEHPEKKWDCGGVKEKRVWWTKEEMWRWHLVRPLDRAVG